VRAISILAFSAGSNADAPATQNQATSPTTSAGPNRSGGAAGRSGVSGASTAGPEGASGASIGSDTPSVERAARAENQTTPHSSGDFALGAVRDRVAGWLGRTSFAARPQLATESAGGMNLGLLTLTALLVGLLGWALLTWSPLSRP
jgi:cobalamin biosynthesis Mg chelatase CobN